MDRKFLTSLSKTYEFLADLGVVALAAEDRAHNPPIAKSAVYVQCLELGLRFTMLPLIRCLLQGYYVPLA